MFDSQSFINSIRVKRDADRGHKVGFLTMISEAMRKLNVLKPELPHYQRVEMIAREYNNAHYLEKDFYDQVVTNRLMSRRNTTQNDESVRNPTKKRSSVNTPAFTKFSGSVRNKTVFNTLANKSNVADEHFKEIDFIEMAHNATLESIRNIEQWKKEPIQSIQ